MPPAREPVSRETIKVQLQIDESDTLYDEQIDALITPAREWCESYQSRAYITQTFELALDAFPCGRSIRLPRPPLVSIESVENLGTDGEMTTWPATNYTADTYAEPGELVRRTAWPPTEVDVNSVVITYTAGYGDTSDDVPATIRQAITLLAVHWFNNGVCDPPAAVHALLNLERVVPI